MLTIGLPPSTDLFLAPQVTPGCVQLLIGGPHASVTLTQNHLPLLRRLKVLAEDAIERLETTVEN
jgi:hypothetical protein